MSLGSTVFVRRFTSSAASTVCSACDSCPCHLQGVDPPDRTQHVLGHGQALVAGRIDEVHRAAQRLQPGRLHGAGSVSLRLLHVLVPRPHRCWLRPVASNVMQTAYPARAAVPGGEGCHADVAATMIPEACILRRTAGAPPSERPRSLAGNHMLPVIGSASSAAGDTHRREAAMGDSSSVMCNVLFKLRLRRQSRGVGCHHASVITRSPVMR